MSGKLFSERDLGAPVQTQRQEREREAARLAALGKARATLNKKPVPTPGQPPAPVWVTEDDGEVQERPEGVPAVALCSDACPYNRTARQRYAEWLVNGDSDAEGPSLRGGRMCTLKGESADLYCWPAMGSSMDERHRAIKAGLDVVMARMEKL